MTSNSNAKAVCVTSVEIAQIKEPDRKSDQDMVELMAGSFEKRGQLCAIALEKDGRKYKLIDGALRLHAAKMLGWTHIEAIIR